MARYVFYKLRGSFWIEIEWFGSNSTAFKATQRIRRTPPVLNILCGHKYGTDIL